MADDPKTEGKSSLAGLRFNATGRDDTSTEILVPKEDPRVRSRRIGLIVLIAVAGFVGIYVSFLRNPITLAELTGKQQGQRFAVPERRAE